MIGDSLGGGWWGKVKDPAIGFAAGGPFGAVVGAGADAVTGGGMFASNPYQVDYSGMPAYPGYQNPYDPNSMAISPQLDQKLNATNLDRTGLDKFKQEAFRVGPSNSAVLQGQQQDMMAADARDRVARSGAGQEAQARTQLAMRGGLGGGAAERIAKSGSNNVMDLSQGVTRQNIENHQQIATNDEQNRIQQLGMVPGMDLNASNFDLNKVKMWGEGQQTDTNNAMKNVQGQNAFNSQKYSDQMAAWAAGQQANATASSGKK